MSVLRGTVGSVDHGLLSGYIRRNMVPDASGRGPMALTRRVEILLEEDEYEALRREAE